MRQFVFWTGIYNIVAGSSFYFPALVSLLGISIPKSNFWLWVPATAFVYFGIVLILCSRNLATRAPIVYWEGLLRIVGFLVFTGFGFWGGIGILVGVLGIVELLIGLVYLIGLPKELNTTAVNLLLDRIA